MTAVRPMRRRSLALVAGLALALAACSGGGSDDTMKVSQATDPEVTDPVSTEPNVTEPVDSTFEPVETDAPPVDLPPAEVLIPDRPIPQQDERDWTVLVYLNAKNDLEPFAIPNLEQIASLQGVTGTVHMAVLLGRTGAYSADPAGGIEAFDSTKLLVPDDAGGLTELADYGQIPMGRPGALREFIAQGIATFPASRYALVFWDHGAGWVGFGVDEFGDSPELLSLPDMASEISAGLSVSPVSKLDLIGFDACLMSTYEVAAALAPMTNFLVASQELEPGHGWDYRAFQSIIDQPGAPPEVLGAAILSAYYDYAQVEGTGDNITLALMDLREMPTLDEALANWSAEVANQMSSLAPLLGRDRATSLSFARSPDPYEDPGLVDLGDLITLMAQEDTNLDALGDPVLAALDRVVVDEVNGPATVGATGLSIYFPVIPDAYNADYDGIDTGATWRSVLGTYFTEGASIPADALPRFQNPNREAAVEFTDTGALIGGLLDESSVPNITETTFYYGLTENSDSVILVGEEAAELREDGFVTAEWEFDLLTLTQGDIQGYGYLSYQVDVEQNLIIADVPFAYTAPDGTVSDVLLEVLIDATTEDIIQQTYYIQGEDGAYGELTPEPGSTIVPEFLRVTGPGETEWFTDDAIVFDATEPPVLDLATIPSGTNIYVRLVATDFGGNTDYVQEQGLLP